MATSDRQQYKQVVAGSIGDLRTLSTVNPLASNGCVSQEAQRFGQVFGQTNIAVNVNYDIPLIVPDRPILVKGCTLIPGINVASNSNTVWKLIATNMNGSSATLSSINSNTTANGGTGNLTVLVATNLYSANVSVNQIVPSGYLLYLHRDGATTTPSELVTAPFTVQFEWEEV